MAKKYYISSEEAAIIEAERRKNKNKRIEKRLYVLVLRAEGKKDREIAEATGFNRQWVSCIVSQYCNQGLQSIVKPDYGKNHRNLSYEEEEALLNGYAEEANDGHILTTSEIKAEYERLSGHKSGGNTIYKLLKRHGWRKVMPRSVHPKKASDEAINASKKLTFAWEK